MVYNAPCRMLIALVGCGMLSSCGGSKALPVRAAAVPIMAATVEKKDVPLQVKAIGAVEAYSNVSVKTQITGELTGVHFKEGQDVNKGQLLFTLDNSIHSRQAPFRSRSEAGAGHAGQGSGAVGQRSCA